MKFSILMLLSLISFMTATILLPCQAEAAVNVVSPWPAQPPIVSNGPAGTVTGKVVVGTGMKRAMLVAVACEYSASTASPTFTVTYGGQSVALVTQSPTTSLFHVWLGIVDEAKLLAAGSNTTLQVQNGTTTNLIAMYATTAVYAGVNQAALTTGSRGISTGTGTATTMTLTGGYPVAGSNGIAGMSLTVAAWNGQASSVTGYTEDSDYTGTNFNLAGTFKRITAAGTETPVSTVVTAAAGAMVGVGLSPELKLATITTCGDCHSYGPVEGSARNVPDGSFVGSHNKHTGTAEFQYSMPCTGCHYNNTTLNHSRGFKNITGSLLPGTSYSKGKQIPVTETPAFGNCSNIYCHSTGRGAGMGNKQYSSARWGSSKNCLSCHGGRSGALGDGNPVRSAGNFTLTTSHSQHLKYPAANINCQICHSQTVTNGITLKQYSGVKRHVNNKRDVTFTGVTYGSYTAYKSNESGSIGTSRTCNNVSCHGGRSKSAWSSTTINTDNACLHCHGFGTMTGTALRADKYNAAPGWGGNGISTDGISANTDIRVGSHFVHLSSVYMKKLKCNECHTVPNTPFEGNHMAIPRYTSPTLAFGQASTANRNGVTPAFTNGLPAASPTCNTTYCHGSSMPRSDTGGTRRSPIWNEDLTTSTPDSTTCGRCHGNPPILGNSSSVHIGSTATTSCTGCHKSVIDATGKIVNKPLHINGIVNNLVDTAVSTSCNKCHGNPPQVVKYGRYSGLVKPQTLALGASPANAGAHLKHQVKGVGCNSCHNNSSAGGHPDASIQIDFLVNTANFTQWNAASPAYSYGTYSGNAPTGGKPAAQSSGGTTIVRTTVNDPRNSCNNYCHGGWNGSNKSMNPSWTSGAAATTCGTCHGATAAKPPLVGTHARHAGYSSQQTARQGYTFACTRCHPGRYVGDNHIKGTVHVRFSTAQPFIGNNAATYTKAGATQIDAVLPDFTWSSNKLAGDTPDGTCSNVYCHSTGRGTGMGTTQYTTTATWGTTTRNCLGCHAGRTGSAGAPAASSAGFRLTTSHSQHLKYPAANMNCQICHSQTVTDGATLKNFSGVKRHLNNKRDVTFTGVTYGSYTAYKSTDSGSAGTSRTCNNVSCHGGKSKNAWSNTWINTDNACLHCHGYGTGTNTALRADKYNAAPGWGGNGISTDGITSSSDIRVGAHFVHLSSVYMKKLHCNECHLVPTTPFEGTHMATPRFNSQTLTFAQSTTAKITIGVGSSSTPTQLAVFSGYTAGTPTKAATCSSTYCHGNRLKTNDTGGTDKKPFWSQNLTTGTPGTTECSRCHGNPPTTGTSISTHSGYVSSPTTSCYTCHPHFNSDGTLKNKALHINGKVEGNGTCDSCHDYDTRNGGGTWGKGTPYTAGGWGAHAVHINYIKKRWSQTLAPASDQFGTGSAAAVCGVCHTNVANPNHATGTPANGRQMTFGENLTLRKFGTADPIFNTGPRTCSNIDCHYLTSPAWQ